MSIHVVLDTNVIFEGLTKQTGACGLLINAWRAGLITVCVTNTLLYEYEDVLGRKLSEWRYVKIITLLDKLLDESAEYVRIYYSWRPSSPDPGDDHVVDCALTANAILVTSNLRDFYSAKDNVGLQVMTPVAFVRLLAGIE